MEGRVALITGASSGIGAATARRLLDLGYTVYGTARSIERLDRLVTDGGRPLAMDVADDASRRAGVAAVLAEAGRIDVLVNNAGYGSYGVIEDVPVAEARAQFDVNLFGAAELIRLVLPQMRERGAGTIVNISSMGGRLYTPYGGWYHASKYALEALSDCLRMEVGPFGIDVVIIEPGAIRTQWGAIAGERLRTASAQGPYAGQVATTADNLEAGSRPNTLLASPPTVVADAVATALTARRPRTRYPVGVGAKPLILLRTILPDRVFDQVIRLVIGSLF
ncbi:oxidoreductase [Microlunatus ginsengisoli]|uniref:Oxidoreductase n=1 Tax=Microlunatus ginsengisoli TaxID=363863 RepID=A0ABP7AWK2_9ACTN